MSYFDLTAQVAVVTGSATGIGEAIARRLAKAGATVGIADLDAAGAQSIAADLGQPHFAVNLDVTDSSSVNTAVQDIVNRTGRLDIWVNNAGIGGKAAPIDQQTDDDWARILAINLSGVFYCCRAVIPHMRQRNYGRIVNIASIAGKEGNPNMTGYSATKAGVIGLTKSVAKEVAREGICVNAVSPAVIRTKILEQLTAEQVSYMTARIPMGRTGTVEEIAAVVHFLASPDCSFVTGQCYDASGEGLHTEVIITADQYTKTPVYDLLIAAANGKVGIDQRLLHAIVDRGEAAVADLVRFGLEDRADDRIRLDEDLVAIFQYLGSPQALPFLVDYLRREPADPAEDLVHAFQRIGAPAIEPLLELYRQLGPKMGSDVAFVLATFRHRDPRILKLLEKRVDDDPADAAFLMGVHGDPAAKPALQKLQDRAARDEDLAEKLGNEATEAFALLDQDRNDEDPEPVSLWDLYPEYIEPVFDVMDLDERIEFLNCSSAELRADAATSFIDREVPDEVVRILVKLAANDPNVGVRAVACTALAGHAEDEEILALLMGKLEDRNKPAPERCGALLAVATAVKGDPNLKGYIDEFYANPSTTARAMEAMWRSLDRDYVEVFRRHIIDADIDIRRQAIKGIGFLEVATEAPRLIDLFRNEEFRIDALFSYAMSVPVKKLERGDMPQLLKKIEELAGGLSEAEGEVLETALDTRPVLHGMEPVFLNFDPEEPE